MMNLFFCTLPDAKCGDYAELSPLASFLEVEGLTMVLTKENAEKANLKFEAVFKGISLTIHSSLEAVGLTAAIATKLAQFNISANVFAAYFHDHVFVQANKAQLALDALKEFAN